MLLGIIDLPALPPQPGLSPSQTHKVLLPEPLGVEEVEYKSVLVAFEDDEPFSEQTMVTAVKLASKRRRAIHVIAVVTVPSHLPLDAALGEQEEAGAVEDRAGQADRRTARQRPRRTGCGRTRPATRSPRRRRELKASALVMGLRYRNGAPLYGKTLQTVLAERPTPGDRRRRAGAGAFGRRDHHAGRGRPRLGSGSLAALEHAAPLVVGDDLVEQALLERP